MIEIKFLADKASTMPHVRRGEAGSRGGDSLVKFSVKLIWTFCILLTRHKHCLSVSVVTKPLTKKLTEYFYARNISACLRKTFKRRKLLVLLDGENTRTRLICDECHTGRGAEHRYPDMEARYPEPRYLDIRVVRHII